MCADNFTMLMQGERIRQARLHRKMSRPEFAEAIDRSLESVKKIEEGKIAFSTAVLMSICTVLKCPSDWVLFGTDAPYKPGKREVRLR